MKDFNCAVCGLDIDTPVPIGPVRRNGWYASTDGALVEIRWGDIHGVRLPVAVGAVCPDCGPGFDSESVPPRHLHAGVE